LKVYKYRGCSEFDRDLKSLVNNEFYMPTPRNLNDPCEGLISTDILFAELDNVFGNVLKVNPDVKSSFLNFKNDFLSLMKSVEKFGVYSLSQNKHDELLWAHYAESHKGFCIEYDLEQLILHENSYDLSHFSVKYNDQPSAFKLTDMSDFKNPNKLSSKLLGIKSKSWEYENEYRFVTANAGIKKYDFRALKSVYFGLRMEDELIDKLMQALKGRNIKYYKVQLKGHSFELTDEKIPDRYSTQNKYMYNISRIEEGAIFEDPAHPELTPYMLKLAEITRREPYCQKVQGVGLSDEKATNDKPLLFAQYWIEKKFVKKEYSLEEIDAQYELINDINCYKKY